MSREDFEETFLSEMPMGKDDIETWQSITYLIDDFIRNGVKIINLDNNLKKMDLGNLLVYYYEFDNEKILGIELERKSYGLVVLLTGKNPDYKNKPPYASDLYIEILRDNSKSIRLLSDDQLSDDGYKLWKRLFDQGYKISIYDKENPGQSFITFYSQNDMDNYIKKDDIEFKKYQYVLSEYGVILAETRNHFHIRRYRELSGLL